MIGLYTCKAMHISSRTILSTADLMKTTILLLALLLAVSSAADDSRLFGRWEWVRTLPDVGAPLITPANTGQTRHRIFDADLTYREYRNGQLFVTATWDAYETPFYTMMIPTLAVYIDPTEITAYYFDVEEMYMYTGIGPDDGPWWPIEYYRALPVANEDSSWGRVKSLYR